MNWRGWLNLAVRSWTNRSTRSNVCPLWQSQKAFFVLNVVCLERTESLGLLSMCCSGIIHWNVVSCVYSLALRFNSFVFLFHMLGFQNEEPKPSSLFTHWSILPYSLIAFRFTSAFRRWPGEDMGLEMWWEDKHEWDLLYRKCWLHVDCYSSIFFLTKRFSMMFVFSTSTSGKILPLW